MHSIVLASLHFMKQLSEFSQRAFCFVRQVLLMSLLMEDMYFGVVWGYWCCKCWLTEMAPVNGARLLLMLSYTCAYYYYCDESNCLPKQV